LSEVELPQTVNPSTSVSVGSSPTAPTLYPKLNFTTKSPLYGHSLSTIQLLLDFGFDVSDIDCFSWLGFPKSAHEFKEIVLLLISSGANPSRISERRSSIDPQMSQLDQCLRNVMAISDIDVRNKQFKAEIIPFLCDLGAKMPTVNFGATPIRKN